MLTRLKISNYALISELEIDFHQGFTVITGETGAGKSIMLGALALILGNRADTRALLDEARKCAIEGFFDIGSYQLESFFKEHDIDYDDLCILRREISPGGRSRAFVNDTPVQLNTIKDLGDRLVDIHSQNATTTLSESSFQLAVIDSFAGLWDLKSSYRDDFFSFRSLEEKLADLREREREASKEEDYLRFLFEELEAARLEREEQESLEERLNVLSHAEEIKSQLFRASAVLSGEEPGSILTSIAEAESALRKVAGFHSGIKQLHERLESISIDMSELAREVADLEEEVEYDPGELEKVQQRLDMIYKLQAKHKVQTVDELIGIREEMDRRLQDFGSLGDQIATLTREMAEQEEKVRKKAGEISLQRKEVFKDIEKDISRKLSLMGMPDAVFRISHSLRESPGPEGKDHIRFLFSANKGMPPEELSRIASGGEQSRVMLAVKSLISQKNLLPTVIFDEIDNGISGDIAGRVGEILRNLSDSMQVIAITHLPQIAGKGEWHFKVFKETGQEVARSKIRELGPEERVEEIATMLGGRSSSQAARQTARELLN